MFVSSRRSPESHSDTDMHAEKIGMDETESFSTCGERDSAGGSRESFS